MKNRKISSKSFWKLIKSAYICHCKRGISAPWMWICHFCKEVIEIIYSRIRYRAITRKGVSNVAEVKPADDFYSYCGFPVLLSQSNEMRNEVKEAR